MHVMIGFGFGVENFSISGVLFVVTSFASLGSQKKENSETGFRSEDVGDVVIFIGEASWFESLASEFQKKERSEMDFIHGDTGDEMSFVGETI